MESWADHTAWVSSTDKKGDKKQQMGHVFTKTTLQDTGLLRSNETVVPSCHTLARTLAILWIKELHAWLEKQQATSCRQIHIWKKKKQQHRPNTHTPWGAPGTPPSKALGRRGGEEEKRGRKLSLGSWHSTWPSASFSVPASQTWLAWWVLRAGNIPPTPAPFWLSCMHLQSPEAAAAGQRVRVSRSQKGSWAATCRASLQRTCSSNGFAKLTYKAPSFFFFQGCKPCFASRAERLAPCSWVAEAIQSCRPHYLQNANAALAT